MTPSRIRIDPEFQSLLPALAPEERAALEDSITAEGCRDALIVWGDTLVDGHNRHEICTRRGIPFETRQKHFDSREDAIIWICQNQSARRNITPEQSTYLLGKRYEAEKKKAGTRTDLTRAQSGHRSSDLGKQQAAEDFVGPGATARRIATELDIGTNTVRRAGRYARAVDTLAADSPTIKRKLLSGEIKQPRAAIVELATQPAQDRKETVEKLERGDPVEETRTCALCGRALPLWRFSTKGKHISSYCKECARAASVNGNAAELRENMHAINSAAESLYGESDQPEYTVADLIDEMQNGLTAFKRMIANVIAQHPNLTTDTSFAAEYAQFINAAVAEIQNIGRK